MIKLLFLLLLSIPGLIHLLVYSMAPKTKWWENLLVVLAVTGTYLVLAFTFYMDQRIGEFLFIASLSLIACFAYIGIYRVRLKWKLATSHKKQKSKV